MSKTIFERIELEKRGKEPHEVIELNLDNCRGLAEVDDDLNNSLTKFGNMECLSLINANLSSVKNFPSLPKLKKLELSDNRVSSGLDNIVKSCPNITHLSLSGNKIADYEALKVLSNLNHLRSLDLFNCEVTLLDEYREKVFEMLPNLEFLDGYDRDDKEDLEDDEYGEMDGEADPDADDAEVEVDEDDEDDDDEDNEDLDEDDDELGEEEEETEGVGLDYLQKDNLELDSEGEDFNPDDEDDDEDVTVEDGEEEEEEQSRGKKRKLEDDKEEGAA